MLAQPVGDQLDVADAVVDEVNLPAAGQLALNRVADEPVVPARDLRLDGQAVFRRRFEIRNVAQADQRHVQRPRNRRGRERQHIDHRPQRLQPLLDIDAEPLLFVDDHQAQVVELDVLRRQAVRADDDVDLARLQPCDRRPLFLRRAEAAELGDVERKLGHPLAEAVKVLLGEDRRRHEHRDLIAAIDRLERGPHRDFGLAEADVAAEQAVHRPRPQHVGLDRGDRGELVGRFAIGKRRVELALPLAVGVEGDARPGPPQGLHFEHFDGQVDDGPFGLLLLPQPRFAADLGQRRPRLRAADVLLHQVDLDRRHENLRAAVELDLQVLFLLPLLLDQPQAAIPADAVGQMDDQVALAQVEERIDRLAQPPPRQPPQLAAMKQLAGGEDQTCRSLGARLPPSPARREPRPRVGRSRNPACSVPIGIMQPAGRGELRRRENLAAAARPRPRSARR